MKTKTSPSPVFCAVFSDGEKTRMSCHCEGGYLDLRRGVRLSIAAYEGRTSSPAVPITRAHFEDSISGKVLAEYDTDAIAKVMP